MVLPHIRKPWRATSSLFCSALRKTQILIHLQGEEAEEYTAVARLEDGVVFFLTSDAEVAKKFGLDKAPALVLLKKETEKRSTFG